ncbi:MAG: energy transducer TonB [Candidatus Sulfotelmatobacter sp.]
MTIVSRLRIRWISAAVVLTAGICFGQRITETTIPLGKALDHALEQSTLTGANANPFHLRVHLFESTNPPSPYRADIEEYWISPKLWRRSIDTPEFKQTLIANGDQVSEQDTGDYYPLWLKGFITALFDPVPNADQWNKLDAKITQITLASGQLSDPCARMKFKVGSDTANNDAFANVCFDGAGLLKFVGSPGYSMEFHDYQRFGKKMIARRYQDDPESGTELVANVVLLDQLRNPDLTLFSIGQPTPPEQRLQSVFVSQATFERAAEGQGALAWPPVQSGKTTGLLSMYVSIDRQGHVREAYPLNSDNAGLQDAARDQLLKWKLKPMAANGVSVQAEAALTFRFETTLANGSAQPTGQASSALSASNAVPSPTVRVSPGVLQGFLVDHPEPVYPPDEKENHIQGKVVLALTIDKTGATRDIRVLTSPDPALSNSAVAAVSRWRYRPYQLNGSPVDVQSTVEVNFTLR